MQHSGNIWWDIANRGRYGTLHARDEIVKQRDPGTVANQVSASGNKKDQAKTTAGFGCMIHDPGNCYGRKAGNKKLKEEI